MNKSELRIKYKEIRKNIEKKQEKSIIITNKIINLKEFKNAKVIGIYKSLKEEVDTNELIEIALNLKKKVVVPKTEGNTINFYEIENNKEFINGKFNILEPTTNKINNNMDLILVPGICFDKENNRIGFGKGYYDKFLNNKNIYKIGLCFRQQLVDKIESESNDIKLDKVISD